MELEAANKSDINVHGICNLDLSVHGLKINMDALVVDLNCSRYSGYGISWETRLNYHLASTWWEALCLAEATRPYNYTDSRQQQKCFAETTDSVCIPPHSEVMLWAKLKTNNGRRGPTAGVVLALQTFVQEFGLLVGRSLVRADAEDWKIPIFNLQLRPVHNAASRLHVQSSHSTSTYTHRARGGDPGDPAYRLSRDGRHTQGRARSNHI